MRLNHIAGWESSYAASNRPGIITVDDRQALCVGICHVLASLPDNQRAKSLHALAMPALDCLETMTRIANQTAASNSNQAQLDAVLSRIADELKILTTMARTFTNAISMNDASMESGCRMSDGHTAIVEPAIAIIRKGWPSISHAASTFNYNEVRHLLCELWISIPCCHSTFSHSTHCIFVCLEYLGVAWLLFSRMHPTRVPR